MKTELLAPAGSYEAFTAAIAAEADAVYLGGSLFGARAYAKNFSDEEICAAIDYAHIHGRKLYLTVNTLLKEEELCSQLYPYLLPFYEQGLDAVIVQDLGAVSAIRKWFPDLPIHASTQMTVTGAAGARFAESIGISRVVPARELSLPEIAKIRDTTNLEIECFVHGALCYCYSGQCLFSSLIGGRSGNRGRCAQPCRLPYQVFSAEKRRMGNGSDSYPLSPKDMCTVELLPEILKAGVTSLKIEGRMKKPEYTAGVVSVYRKYLDLYEKNPNRYRVLPEDQKKLMDLYNRDGFNKSYYTVRNGRDMMALKNEKNTDDRKKQKRNEQLFYEIQRDYLNAEVKEPVSGFLSLYSDQPAALCVFLGDSSVTVEAGWVEKAQKHPLTEERVRTQMEKTGNTPFFFEHLDISMEEDIFVPMQTLSELRRNAMEKLQKEITSPYHRQLPRTSTSVNNKNSDTANARSEHTSTIRVQVENRAQLKGILSVPEITGIYAGLECFREEDFLDHALETLQETLQKKKQLFLSLPHATRDGELGKYRDSFRILIEEGLSGFLVRNLESLSILREMNLEQYVVLDYSIYTMNQETRNFWKREGILYDTVPYELNYRELLKRDNSGSEMTIYGYLPMMVSAQCVQKTMEGCTHRHDLLMLKDRYNKEFPVKCCCGNCYNVIYNSLPLGLLGEKEDVLSLNCASLRLAFTIETEKEVIKICEAYIAAYLHDEPVKLEMETTKGHFRRKVE
ncbi:MAG: U32 family peptidase [Lachnospiraceae bacterium]|nr:U32 family peptidase [Lachnospiraceae bacterium]